MQIKENSKPWHSYPLVWMMIFIPFIAVIMGVVMLWLAIDTDDGLVADDYYKQGLEINRVIERDKKAAELGLSATIEFDNSASVIKVTFDKGSLNSYPNNLPLHLQHATRANSDITVILDHGIDNQYIGHTSQSISEGIWYFTLTGDDETSNGGTVDEVRDSAAREGAAREDKAGWKISARSHVHKINTVHLKSDY